MAFGILVPGPEIEPTPPAVEALEAWSLNHWTIREVPRMVISMEENKLDPYPIPYSLISCREMDSTPKSNKIKF